MPSSKDVLYRGRVVSVTEQGAFVEVAALGVGALFGPCEVPMEVVAPGDLVVCGQIGGVTEDLVILGQLFSEYVPDPIDVPDGSITAAKLATGSVTTEKILNGTILNEDINPAAGIDLSKLAVDPLDRANHTGTQLAATISDLTSAVQTVWATHKTTVLNSGSLTGGTTYNVTHNLGSNTPIVQIYDNSTNEVIYGLTIKYLNTNQISVTPDVTYTDLKIVILA